MAKHPYPNRAIVVNAVLLYRAVFHLRWMADTLQWQQEQTGIGAEASEEIQDAKSLCKELMELCQGHNEKKVSDS